MELGQGGLAKMKVALDTNCFIDAVNSGAQANAVRLVLEAHESGGIIAMVSRHTLAELLKPPEARRLAETLPVLPYWPIGTIAEQVATIEQLTGTWEEARRNEEIQNELEQLAKSGNDIRDRGAFLDAWLGGADVFVTSDKQLVGSGPSRKIRDKFGIRVLRPADLANEVSQCPFP
jgi:predicted nucleic acid-binding protein